MPKDKAPLIHTYANRADWLEGRRRHIGASDSPSIFGVGYNDAKTVWAEKVGKVLDVEDDDADENEIDAMDIGTIMQPAIIEVARQVLGIPITAEPDHTIRIDPEHPWMAASLDAWTLDDSGLLVPVEIKNVGLHLSHDWSQEEPPLAFAVQAHHQMAVTGAKRAILFGLIGGNKPAWHTIERNEAFIETMLAKLEEFWGYVTRHEEPPDELSDPVKVAKAIVRLHPNDNGATVDLPFGLVDVESQIQSLTAEKAVIEDKLERAKNQFKEAIGDATFGALPNGRYASWKTQTMPEHVRKESTFRVLRFSDKKPKGEKSDKPAKKRECSIPGVTPTKRTRYGRQRRAMLAINPHCRWCGCTLTSETATVDHVVPLAAGGSNAQENLCLACFRCNQERGDSGADISK